MPDGVVDRPSSDQRIVWRHHQVKVTYLTNVNYICDVEMPQYFKHDFQGEVLEG